MNKIIEDIATKANFINEDVDIFKVGVMSEGIFNLIPSSKIKPNHYLKTFYTRVKSPETKNWFIF